MREIKFRAWNILTNTMIDLKKVTPLALNIDTDGLFIPFSGMPLMQYTGLEDCEGRDVYESDIIEIDGGGKSTIKSVVFFKDGCYCVDIENRTCELKYYINVKFCKTKIIGNIYENPELVK